MRFLLFLVGFIAGIFSVALAQPSTYFVTKPNSSIQVFTASNVSKSMTCKCKQYDRTDTLRFFPSGDSMLITGYLIVPIKNFSCENFIYTANMHKTLKATQFPYLRIRFFSTASRPVFTQQTQFIPTRVEISLAGVSIKTTILIGYAFNSQSMLLLTGNNAFKFSDFEIEAPNYFGNLVRVNNSFRVQFNLFLNPLP